jgi:hypothetical protein
VRKASYGKRNRLKSIFTWCVCLVVCGVLALSGTSLFVPKPAQAICQINPLPPAYECQNYMAVVSVISFVGGYTGPDQYTCTITSFSGYQNPPLPAGMTISGATIYGCPPAGSRGTYRLGFMCQEYKNQQYYPGPGPQSYEKYVDLTIYAGPTGCTCGTGTGTSTGGTTTGGSYNFGPTTPQAPTTYTFTVSIGPGLTEGETQVLIDGKKKATLAGGDSEDFEAATGTSPVVSVESTITGQQGNKFTVKDTAEKKVSEGDTSAYFDYAPAVYIEFVTDPSGLTALAGSDWYSIGDKVQSSAPATVDSGKSGTQYQFAYWALPNGQKSQMKSLSLTVSAPATVKAVYDTYYKLTVSSAYGEDDTTWQKAGEEATWQVKTPQAPMEGFLGLLGGKIKAVNSSGKTTMDGPKNITVDYKSSPPWLVLILIAAAVIVGGFFVYRRLAVSHAGAPIPATEVAATKIAPRPRATTRAAAPPAKQAVTKATTKAKSKAGSKFCSKCGTPVAPDEIFCSNCGKKLK